MPAVTITTPAYNGETTLRESVDSALAQTFTDFELVVVDDGSRIPVTEVLAGIDDPRLRIVRHPVNRGLGAARMTALAEARSPLIAHLDADDRYEPEFLEALVPCLDDPAVGLAYPQVKVFGDDDHLYIDDPERHPVDRFPELALRNPIPNFTVVRRSALEDVGGYATFAWGAMDWYLYMRLAATGWRFAYVDRVLAHYRWSDLSMSRDWDNVQRSALQVLTRFMLHHPFVRGPHRPAAALALRRAGKRVPGARAVRRSLRSDR
jgi:glycosyltransferase involved in cell wall biosynthesis